jgi:hypothetical protein
MYYRPTEASGLILKFCMHKYRIRKPYFFSENTFPWRVSDQSDRSVNFHGQAKTFQNFDTMLRTKVVIRTVAYMKIGSKSTNEDNCLPKDVIIF